MVSTKTVPVTSEGASHPRAGQARVCIVTAELEGPFLNGGVGSTNRALALTLKQMGYQVSVLYTQVAEGKPICLRGTFAGHVEAYAREGIEVVAIRNMAPGLDWSARAWLVLQHLLQSAPDLVFFDDIFGTGYYALLARRTGAPELAGTAMVVTAHGALEWVSEQEEVSFLNFDGLSLFEMERRSLELADVVRAPSRYILQKYASYGWNLPPDPVVMPNFVFARKDRSSEAAPGRTQVNEIVFFGRLETRKGIWLFLRAIDRIKYRLNGATVSFLGKSRDSAGLILRHALGWPFKVRVLTDFNQDQAVAYLRGPGRLAVMPSPEDNSPSTVLECLERQIPFLATSGSGAEELIDPECHAETLVSPTVDALAAGILRAVDTGSATARHAYDPDLLLARFSAFVERMLASRHIPVTIGQRNGTMAVLALAPFGQDPVTTASLLRQGKDRLDGSTVVHVLSSAPDRLRPLVQDLGVHVWSHTDLGTAANDLAGAGPAVVALCDTGAIPDRGWFDRAATCFAANISAVTGMVRMPEEHTPPPAEPWISRAPTAAIRRYLIGHSPAMMTLVQSTNDGFALVRAEVLELLPKLQASDPSNGKLWPTRVILHELMAAITASGGRFELVPDLPAPFVMRDPLTENVGEGRALQHAAAWLNRTDGSHWAATRLGQDAGIDRIRRDEAYAWREALSQKTGFAVPALDAGLSWANQADALAQMASAAGQTDLAVELIANLHPYADHLRPGELNDFVRSGAAAIYLASRYRQGAFQPLNLIHDYSIKDVSEIEFDLHANTGTEPRATLIFPDVDLSRLDTFLATVNLPDPRARPVRLRIDILADSGAASLTIDRLVKPGASEHLLAHLSPDLRTPCKVILGLEMANPLDTHTHAYIRVIKSGFVQFKAKGDR